jgi:hypothetical protein
MLKLARKFFHRARELLYAEENVGSVGTDILQHVLGTFGSAPVRSSVSRNPLRFFSLLRYHTEIALHQVRHTLGFGYRR